MEDFDELAMTMTVAQCTLGEKMTRDAVLIAYTVPGKTIGRPH